MDIIRSAIERSVLNLTGMAIRRSTSNTPQAIPAGTVLIQPSGRFTETLAPCCAGHQRPAAANASPAGPRRRVGPLPIPGGHLWPPAPHQPVYFSHHLCPSAVAEQLVGRVKAIHLRINGVDDRGVPYAASDPALLTGFTWQNAAALWRRTCATGGGSLPLNSRTSITPRRPEWR